MRSTIALAFVFCAAFFLSFQGVSVAQERASTSTDKLLPRDTLLYFSIDDYGLYKKYAQSMPLEKILAEEEVVEFLKKPKEYLESKIGFYKEMLSAQGEGLGDDLDSLLVLDLSRVFFALTHVTLPPMDEEAQDPPIPDVGVAIGLSFEGDGDPLAIIKSFVPNLVKSQGQEVVFEKSGYNGVEYEKLSAKDIPLPFYVFFFRLDDMLVVSYSETSMQAMIDLHSGKRDDSLAGAKGYAALDSSFNLDEKGSVDFYMNMQGIASLVKDGIKMAIMMNGDADDIGKVDLIAEKSGLLSLGSIIGRGLSKNGVAHAEAIHRASGDPTGFLSIFPSIPLTDKHFQAVPKDAVSFSIFRADLAAAWDLTMDMIQSADEEMYEEMQMGMKGFFEAMSAGTDDDPIDIRRDVLGQLGTSAIIYSQEASSMGMMMPSFNLLVEVKDYDKFTGTLKAIFDGLSNMNPEVSSQVTFTSIPYDGQDIHYFQFAQVPMMMPCFSRVGDYLAFGLQLDDVKKMIKHHKASKGCIMDNEDFTSLYSRLAEGKPVVSVKYSKVKSVFSSSYNQIAMSVPMLTMALPPDVELPVDLQLLPTADCIASHLFSSVTVSVLEGDGVTRSRSCGPLGCEMLQYTFDILAMTGCVVGDYLMTAIQAPDEALISFDESEIDEGALMEAEVRSDLAGLSNACFIYKIENNDMYPPSLEELLKPTDDWPDGIYKADKLPIDPWGNPYHYTKSGSGYMVWSSGPNGIDEQGSGDDIAKKK